MDNNPASPGQCLSAGARFATFLGSMGATHESLDAFIKNGNHPFYAVITEHFGPKTPVSMSAEELKILEPVCRGWCEFYKKFFGISLTPEELYPIIPKCKKGFTRLIIIVKGIRLNQVWNVHKEKNIPIWQWWIGSLENSMQESERGQIKETYAIWVRDAQEAIDVDDELLKELSAKTIAERCISTEDLLERLIHGLKYYDETGNHLDVRGVTLCASSRYSDGDVPGVNRSFSDGVRVLGCDVTNSNPDIRARLAVR